MELRAVTNTGKEGISPEAINNYLALLGWSHPEGKEVMSEQEMIQAFSVERINAALQCLMKPN